MIAVLISALLFGLVHPGSKWIMEQHISLLPFCTLYIGIRLLAQIPLAIRSGNWKIESRRELYLLLALGGVGATLQLSEFFGISAGLPVPVVTFLVYSHPIWTALLGRIINGEPLTKTTLAKVGVALIGILLIFRPDQILSQDIGKLMAPLGAGFMIALWVTLSNRAAKAGVQSLKISFYYDLFGALILFSLWSKTPGRYFAEASHFMSVPSQAISMIIYSILIGFVPNILFYRGSKTISSIAAGLILLAEPVVATLTSTLVWHDPLGPLFFVGAAFVLFSNVPPQAIASWANSFCRFIGRSLGAKPAVAMAGVILLSSSHTLSLANGEPSKEIHVIDLSPAEATDYNVASEGSQIEAAADMAKADYSRLNPSCQVNFKKDVRTGTEEDLFKEIESLAKTAPNSVVVGLSRSNFARLAAKAAQGSDLVGLSIGAAAANLKEINPRFLSVASPWTKQWEAIEKKMKQLNCTATDALGVFDASQYLSARFRESFEKTLAAAGIESTGLTDEKFLEATKSKRCLFIAVPLSVGQRFVRALLRNNWNGFVFGIGDWNIYARELKSTLAEPSRSQLTVFAPTGWKSDVSVRSARFAGSIKERTKEEASPIAAYTYDAVTLALHHACGKENLLSPNIASLRKLPLLRHYEGIANSGNFLSEIYLLEFQSQGKRP